MGGRTPLVVVVILNWNNAQQSAACIAALQRQSHANLRIVLVDNGSAKGSLTLLHELGASFVLLRNNRNLGFTGGVNVGITRALAEGADYIWLLNNDAQPAPDALRIMLDAVGPDERIGLASPLIRNADAADAIEFCGGLRQAGAFATTNDPAVYRSWSEQSPDRIWLVGTALLIRRQVVESIGLFDERFFAYWEDNDYSLRSAQAGFRNVVVAGAVVRHWSGNPLLGAAAKPPHYHYYMARNEVLFLRKHAAWRDAPRALLWAADRQFRHVGRLRGHPASADAALAGLWDGLRGRGGAYDPGRPPPRAAIVLLRAARRLAGHHA